MHSRYRVSENLKVLRRGETFRALFQALEEIVGVPSPMDVSSGAVEVHIRAFLGTAWPNTLGEYALDRPLAKSVHPRGEDPAATTSGATGWVDDSTEIPADKSIGRYTLEVVRIDTNITVVGTPSGKRERTIEAPWLCEVVA